MRFPRVRFTVRRMMLAAAVIVTLSPLAAGIVWWLSPEQVRLRALISAYEAKAKHHAELEREFARLSKYSDKGHGLAHRGGQRVHIPLGQDPELVPKYVELAKYHRALEEKYESAAWNPRVPIQPDPPPPEP